MIRKKLHTTKVLLLLKDLQFFFPIVIKLSKNDWSTEWVMLLKSQPNWTKIVAYLTLVYFCARVSFSRSLST